MSIHNSKVQTERFIFYGENKHQLILVSFHNMHSLRKHAQAINRDFLHCKKMNILSTFFFVIFLIFAQNMDCGYTQSMF